MALISSGKSHTRYPASSYVWRGTGVLTDGIKDYGDGNWTWMEYRDHVGSPYYMYAIIDLGAIYNITNVRFAYAPWSGAHIYSPAQAIFETNDDNGATWTNLATLVRDTDYISSNVLSSSNIVPHWSNLITVSGSGRYHKLDCM